MNSDATGPNITHTVIAGYAADSAELIARYEAICQAELFEPVSRFLPTGSARIIDIGAGTGATAKWFADMGNEVLAVEPVAEFRQFGQARSDAAQINWVDDTLPVLRHVADQREAYDLALIIGVWQHLDTDQRRQAFPAIRALIRPGGRLLMSLRHGPGVPTRPCRNIKPAEEIALARGAGFEAIFWQSADSIQTANLRTGVTWTWLVFNAI